MFIDTREVNQGTPVQTTVCIIGGGVAGITIALELDKHGIATCLLESGGFGPDDQTRDLYRGENVGLPYSYADGCRSRFLGGSSNCWGGWCRPWESWEFEKREWIPNSGWPLDLVEVNRYLQRVHKVLQLGPLNYNPAFWEAAVNRSDVRRVPLAGGNVRDILCQFSPPTRFGKVYRTTLERSSHVTVYLHANVVELETDSTARNVRNVRVRTLTGKTMRVSARLMILATGGIENARLLLASNNVQTTGLGNSHDLVGRFFMDHPRLYSGSVRIKDPWTRNMLYDAKFHHRNPSVAANGTRIAAQFALVPEVMKREQLLGCSVWFSSIFPGENSEAMKALVKIEQSLIGKVQFDRSLGQDFVTLMTNPIDTVGFALSQFFRLRSFVRGVRLQAIIEPDPNSDSRVTLSNEKDQLGMNRVRVMWKLGSAVQRTFDRTLAIMADDLKRSGIADIILDPALEGGSWPTDLEGTWHHMGTTRMHDSPHYGVVDRNCRVHSVNNLYIAGSSVFPTAGTNYPTITIVALALRLADHVVNELRRNILREAGDLDSHARADSIPNLPVSEIAGHIQA
jgi:choline dehydrogenase-like flavoprotein